MSEAKNTQLFLRLSERELEAIQDNAKACDKTVSAYAREVLVNMCSINISYENLREHKQRLNTTQQAIIQLIFTIRKTGNYAPKDIEYILEKLNEIFEIQSDISDKHNNYVYSAKREIRREARRIVREHLKKEEDTK